MRISESTKIATSPKSTSERRLSSNVFPEPANLNNKSKFNVEHSNQCVE